MKLTMKFLLITSITTIFNWCQSSAFSPTAHQQTTNARIVTAPRIINSSINSIISTNNNIRGPVTKRSLSVLFNSSNDPKKNEQDQIEEINPIAKASWYAVEQFGKLFAPQEGETKKGNGTSKALQEIDVTKPPSSAKETLERIKLDNDRDYFLSGQVDSLIYDKDCVFADPFVSFSGRDRFVENLKNLGSFITKYNARMLNYEVSDDELVVDTKVMVKLELNLPWKPILAWPWGVRYDIDQETFLVTNHKESWDIGAMDGVKQIFRKPTLKI